MYTYKFELYGIIVSVNLYKLQIKDIDEKIYDYYYIKYNMNDDNFIQPYVNTSYYFPLFIIPISSKVNQYGIYDCYMPGCLYFCKPFEYIQQCSITYTECTVRRVFNYYFIGDKLSEYTVFTNKDNEQQAEENAQLIPEELIDKLVQENLKNYLNINPKLEQSLKGMAALESECKQKLEKCNSEKTAADAARADAQRQLEEAQRQLEEAQSQLEEARAKLAAAERAAQATEPLIEEKEQSTAVKADVEKEILLGGMNLLNSKIKKAIVEKKNLNDIKQIIKDNFSIESLLNDELEKKYKKCDILFF